MAVAHTHAALRWKASQRVTHAVHNFLRDAIAERGVLRRIKFEQIAARKETAVARKAAMDTQGRRPTMQVLANHDPWYTAPDAATERTIGVVHSRTGAGTQLEQAIVEVTQ